MTRVFLLDWALITVSLFNTILLLWLGLTILLNSERRSLGVWMLGSGLLLGAGFFISHTAILGSGLPLVSSWLNFWWVSGWLPVVVAPLAWYGMILWFAGFWSPDSGPLRRRHRWWLGFQAVFMLILLIVLYIGHGLPTFLNIAHLNLSGILTIGGLPVLLVFYPVYMVLCIGLAIDALRRPAHSERFMGDLARQRTYPWLLTATLTLLVVSLLVGWFMLWAVGSTRAPGYIGPSLTIISSAAWFDIGIQLLIALAVFFIGQAIVSYEIFTGKSLPRREFFRHWRDALILASGYAAVVGWSLTFNLNPIYSLLMTTFLMVAFYAMFSWRSFIYRDQFMAQLRPFVHSQQLMEHLADDTPSRASIIFWALCKGVLNVKYAQLLPKGALAALAGPDLNYPLEATYSDIALPGQIDPDSSFLPVEDHPQLRWAVPLWAERGLIGVLALGEKIDGGLFSLEEIEIARATGERVVDMLASEEIARRLVDLQRRRMAETQVLDHRTRRMLHDEILPELHTLVLKLGGRRNEDSRLQETLDTLSSLHSRISDLIYVHPGLLAHQEAGGDFLAMLRRMVQAEFAGEFAAISWQGDMHTPQLEAPAQEVAYHAVREVVRNAAIHGRGDDPQRELNLTISIECDDQLSIIVQDDGVGNDQEAVGRQGGIALHSTMLAVVGGTLTTESIDDKGTTVKIQVPIRGESLVN